ncbi:MAG: hypothetical protein Q4C60_10545 [Eubacteriales bacterium]|nr:hypothetical protein [Eubacteriales bacterium]
MKQQERLFTNRDLQKLILPLMAELALNLVVGMMDTMMVSGICPVSRFAVDRRTERAQRSEVVRSSGQTVKVYRFRILLHMIQVLDLSKRCL